MRPNAERRSPPTRGNREPLSRWHGPNARLGGCRADRPTWRRPASAGLSRTAAQSVRRSANSSGNSHPTRRRPLPRSILAEHAQCFGKAAMHPVEGCSEATDLIGAAVAVFGRVDLAHAHGFGGPGHSLDGVNDDKVK